MPNEYSQRKPAALIVDAVEMGDHAAFALAASPPAAPKNSPINPVTLPAAERLARR
jgi:hypothetical protein